MKTLLRDGVKYTLSDATRSLYFEVIASDVSEAERLSKTSCVIARALQHTVPRLTRVEVGSNVTYIFFLNSANHKLGEVKRYSTTEFLSDALNEFDKTGQWKIPDGVYHLLPPQRKLGKRKDYLTPAGRANSATRAQRPARTGKHTLKHINPRFIQFSATGQ